MRGRIAPACRALVARPAASCVGSPTQSRESGDAVQDITGEPGGVVIRARQLISDSLERPDGVGTNVPDEVLGAVQVNALFALTSKRAAIAWRAVSLSVSSPSRNGRIAASGLFCGRFGYDFEGGAQNGEAVHHHGHIHRWFAVLKVDQPPLGNAGAFGQCCLRPPRVFTQTSQQHPCLPRRSEHLTPTHTCARSCILT